jgi:hypothetical protein
MYHGYSFALVLLFAGSVLAQGGPPFRSDDPGTPGNRHWEINIAGIGERNPVQGTYSLPNFDINYGLGDRIQLKYEQAAGLQETRGSSPQLLGGVGNSIAGFKYRFYEHLDPGGKESNFALAIYPQLVFSTVRASVRRGISDPAQLYLPIEYSLRVRGVLISAETGYWLPRKQVPSAWVQAGVIGHKISDRSELFVEIYHESQKQNQASAATHDATIGIGGRQDLNKNGSVRLLVMLGHSLFSPDPAGARPQWVGYLGVQLLVGQNGK